MAEEPCCFHCGLFQILNADTREFVSVEPSVRETGEIPLRYGRGGPFAMYERQFACFAGRPINAELTKVLDPTHSWKTYYKEAITRARPECNGDFVRLVPGMPPKDHREMKLLAEVERRNTAWRAEDDRWKKQIEALAETRHQELRRDAESDRKANRNTNYMVAGIAFLSSIIAAALAAYLTVYFSPK